MLCAACAKNSGKKSTRTPSRIFLDTSVVISGLYSPTGASAAVVSLAKLGRLFIYLSPEVIAEAERTIDEKLPDLATPWFDLLLSQVSTTSPVTTEELRNAYKDVPTEDASIFAGFLKSNAEILLTLDKEFQQLATLAGSHALSPGEFLQLWRGSRDPNEI